MDDYKLLIDLLPEHCWQEEYYWPMQARFEDFLNRNGNTAEACEIVTAEQHEIDLYEAYKSYISYGVYIARKLKMNKLVSSQTV